MPKSQEFGVGITGLGKHLPKNKVTTEELAKKLNLIPSDIVKNTGIKSRYYASSEETASAMSAASAKEALEQAKIQPEDVGLIVGLTTSGDYVFPALGAKIQNLIGAKKAGAFDLSASASSFPVAVGMASDRLRYDSSLHHVLVVGTAVQTRYIDWNNKDLAVILGDASGAAVLSRVAKCHGVLISQIQCDGSNYDAARLRGGGSSFPMTEENVTKGLQYIEMNGVTMGREFLKRQPTVIRDALKKIGQTVDDVRLFVFHQANLRLIQILMKKMGQPWEKTVTNAESIGNTAEASIPTALYDAANQGKLRKGDLVVLSGLGAGSIIAVTVLRW